MDVLSTKSYYLSLREIFLPMASATLLTFFVQHNKTLSTVAMFDKYSFVTNVCQGFQFCTHFFEDQDELLTEYTAPWNK